VNERRKLVVVTPVPPRHDAAHGGGRITAEAIEHLASRHDVTLLTLRGDDEPSVDRQLVESCAFVEEVRRERVRLSPTRLWAERRRVLLAARGRPAWVVGHAVSEMRRRLDEVVRDVRADVVQLEYLALADLASAVSMPRPPIVLVEHDARPSAGTARKVRWRSVRRDAARSVQAIVTFSDEDARVVRKDVGAARVVVIRPGLDLPPKSGAGVGDNVLFVGNFHHPPNATAALRLVREIHPRVRRVTPGATLTIIGDGAPGTLAEDGVRVEGRVADVRPFLEAAAVVAAPLSEGGGVRIKVLEALASGKALVASPRAVEGLAVHSGEHVIVAEGDEATADAIVTLLHDAELRSRLGKAARAWAEDNLSWDVALDRYDRLYDELTRR